MTTNYTRYLRVLLMLAMLSFGIGAAKDAHAVNNVRFCARFATSYRDIRSGQDYLINSTEAATRHWAVVKRFTTTIFNGYLIGNCTPWLPIGGTFHEFWVTNEVEVEAGKYLGIYPNTNEQYLWHMAVVSTPINPIGDSEYVSTFTGTLTDHVSLLAARHGASSLVIPPGSNPNLVVYKIYADDPGLSRTVGNNVYIGHIAVNGVDEKDAYWRSVVGHEMAHQVAARMFGTWNVNYAVNTSTNDACNCNNVEVAADQAHCMNSREQVGAARAEAWAHSFSTWFVNVPSDSTAPFGYYKRFYDPSAPGNHILYPPFTVNALTNWQWMEAYCNQANAGIEMDWMSFFYQLDNKTTDAWNISNFWSVFQTECGAPPINSCTVTWPSLQNATTTYFGLGHPKAAYLTATGDANGVNH